MKITQNLKIKSSQRFFLKYNINEIFEGKNLAIPGNFPYNIFNQIVFRAPEYRNQNRICRYVSKWPKDLVKKGNSHGIFCPFCLQAFYDAEYLFTVDENVFIPPPKVNRVFCVW
jgi:16S rRNA (adenine1518-N6/adenine1519-N6)-dimethyltransferase